MNTLDWITAWLLCGLFVIATGFTFAGDGDFLPDCTNVVAIEDCLPVTQNGPRIKLRR